MNANFLSPNRLNIANINPDNHVNNQMISCNDIDEEVYSAVSVNWASMKNHSAKCNITLKKKRRGNKRSKSLPSRFR
jgi:hypothetical protein